LRNWMKRKGFGILDMGLSSWSFARWHDVELMVTR
jgi:hypothetical protein